MMYFALLLTVTGSGKFCSYWFWTVPPCEPLGDSCVMASKLQPVFLYTVQKFGFHVRSQLDEPVFP